MTSPILHGRRPSNPLRSLYFKWIKGTTIAWPADPGMTVEEDRIFRKRTLESMAGLEAEDIAKNLFSIVRSCTCKQMQALAQAILAIDCTLDVSKVPMAISDFGEYGSISKIRALYPMLTWKGFDGCAGMHECLSGDYMPQYINAVVQWCNDESVIGEERHLHQEHMLMALQECTLDASTIVEAMTIVKGEDFKVGSIIRATSHVLSNIESLKPGAIAKQLLLLHEGWGIQYPAALVQQIAQEVHATNFRIPPVEMLMYPTAQEDIQVANVFKNTDRALDGNTEVIRRASIIQACYSWKAQWNFCVDAGVGMFSKESIAELKLDSNVFQDIGSDTFTC